MPSYANPPDTRPNACRYHRACGMPIVGHVYSIDPATGHDTTGPVPVGAVTTLDGKRHDGQTRTPSSAMPVCAAAYRAIAAGITAHGPVNSAGQTIAVCDCGKGDYCPQYGRETAPRLNEHSVVIGRSMVNRAMPYYWQVVRGTGDRRRIVAEGHAPTRQTAEAFAGELAHLLDAASVGTVAIDKLTY